MDSRGCRAAVLPILLGLLSGAACVKPVVESGLPDSASCRKVLIAVYPSEFKDRIAEALVDRYKDRARVTLASIRDLNSVDSRKYDALVIIDQLMAWQMFNFESAWYLERLEDPDARQKVVLYLTAGSPKKDYTFHGFDAMTGATAMNREGEAVEEISGRIDALLAPR